MKKFWLLVGLGLLVRLVAAWLPLTLLIPRTLPDDAFIYFVIARNIANGLGATFDGLGPTNGFHPLWALAVAPLFRLAPNGDLPIHWALTLAAICDVGAGVMAAWVVSSVAPLETPAPTGCFRLRPRALSIFQISSKGLARLGTPAGLITLALYLFNPRAVQESVNGLETGLAMLMLGGCVAAWAWLMESPESKSRAVLFGALAGLAVLARTDLGLIVAVLSAALLLKRRWIAMAIAVGVVVAVVAPWFAWSQFRVGTVAQSSGAAIPSLVAYRIQTSPDFGELWGSILFPIINYSVRYTLIYPGVALIAVIAGILFGRWPGRRSGPLADLLQPGFLWLPGLGALLIVFAHTFVRWYPRGWYFAPLAWSGAVVGGLALAAGLATPAGRRFGLWALAVLGLIVVAQSLKMIDEPEYKWQSDMCAGAEWLAQNVAPTETVGAFNAGIYAYYSEQKVLSLDGLVDWKAIEARQQKRLLDYFAERGGSLIIEHEAYIASFRPFFGARTLEPLTLLPVTDKTYGPIIVYRLKTE